MKSRATELSNDIPTLATKSNLLRTFANRACMLKGCGVFAAYGRGFRVLVDNIGSALPLFVIQAGIGRESLFSIVGGLW